ncbi:YciI family protein [Rickettsiales bacterium LUAb2]
MFVTILSYKVTLEQILEARPAHVDFLDKYYEKKVFIMSGRQKSNKGGIIIANCSSEEELWSILKEDPFYKQNLADYKVIEFSATKFTNELKDIIKD